MSKKKQEVEKASGKKKKKDSLVSVLNESVVEAALTVFRENEAMTVEFDGKTQYVAMVLDVNSPSIGGINRKTRKDEDKGQIIEHINSGNIHAYLPLDFLERDLIMLIPDVETLNVISEFSLLTDADYTLGLVFDDGSVEETEVAVTFAGLESVITGERDIYEYLSEAGLGFEEEGDTDEDAEEDVDVKNFSDIEETENLFGDDESNFEDQLAEYQTNEEGESDPIIEEKNESVDESEDVIHETETVVMPEETEEDEPEDEDEDDVVVTEEEVNQAIIRKFYSDDLGLEITTEPFDAIVRDMTTIDLFVDDRDESGDGMLNKWLNEMAKEANLDLQRVHKANLFKMRDLYYDLISKHAEMIQKKLDETDPNTEFGKLKLNLDDEMRESYDNIRQKVAERRKEIDEEWDKSLMQIGEDAKAAAQRQYTERYGKQREMKIYSLESDIIKELEDMYQDSIKKMHDDRKLEAAKLMDYGIAETLREVIKVYEGLFDEEKLLYEGYKNQIKDFLDDNRKHEIARIETLREELDQMTKAEKTMQEYEQKIKTLEANFDARVAEIKEGAEIDKHKAEEDKKLIRDDYAYKLSEMKEENIKLKGELSDLLQQYSDLDDKKERAFALQLNEAKDLAKAWSDKYNGLVAMQKKLRVISVAAVLALIAMAGVVGFLVGTNISLSFGSSEAVSIIEQEFNERLDSAEELVEEE